MTHLVSSQTSKRSVHTNNLNRRGRSRHLFFFFNDTATTEIYTLSLHDALPISMPPWSSFRCCSTSIWIPRTDRKSTRLNSSHSQISYAVFCLKKKKICQLHPQSHRHLRRYQYCLTAFNPPVQVLSAT